MACVRIDESGYTGADLMNPDQRFQGACAVRIGNYEAAQLIREHFPKLQAPELKYSSLSRRPNYQKALLALQASVLQQHRCVTYVCDKRFLLTMMLLSYVVEPYYYQRGFDFYQDGQHYAMGSLLYRAGPALLGDGALEAILTAFQRAAKEKSRVAIVAFVQAVRAARWQELPECLGPLAAGEPECLAAIADPGVTTDAAFVVLQALITQLEAHANGPYAIEHDRSKNLLAYHRLLQRMIGHTAEAEFRHSDIATLRFPLQLTSVTQVDSKDSPAVQVADVLVGAALEAANGLAKLREPLFDPQDVLGLYRENQFIHLIPSLDFAAERKARHGAQGGAMIDYFARHFAGDS